MTGFARVRRSLPEGEMVLSLKTVNHRGLDIHFHLPPEMEVYEAALREAIKGKLARGHVQVRLAFAASAAAGAPKLNRPLLAAYFCAFEQAAREFGLEEKPSLEAALRLPGMLLAEPEVEPDSGLEPAVMELAGEALGLLNRFREREGAAMAAEMRHRCAAILEVVDRIEKIRGGALPAFQKRLQERLQDLLAGAGIEPQRLIQEAALLADRSDISEELVRLKTHAAQLTEMLAGAGEVGKRLDFLLQEMNREANTVLSKTGGLGELGLTITELALSAKAEIDKIREQALNLE